MKKDHYEGDFLKYIQTKHDTVFSKWQPFDSAKIFLHGLEAIPWGTDSNQYERYRAYALASVDFSAKDLDMNTIYHVNKKILDVFKNKPDKVDLIFEVLKHGLPTQDGVPHTIKDLKTAVLELQNFGRAIAASKDFTIMKKLVEPVEPKPKAIPKKKNKSKKSTAPPSFGPSEPDQSERDMTDSYAEDFVAFLQWLVKDVEEADINKEVLEQARSWFVHLVLLHEVTVEDAKSGKTKQIKFYKNLRPFIGGYVRHNHPGQIVNTIDEEIDDDDAEQACMDSDVLARLGVNRSRRRGNLSCTSAKTYGNGSRKAVVRFF